jgi:hypothetical protein
VDNLHKKPFWHLLRETLFCVSKLEPLYLVYQTRNSSTVHSQQSYFVPKHVIDYIIGSIFPKVVSII